jgi:hypothetical protein
MLEYKESKTDARADWMLFEPILQSQARIKSESLQKDPLTAVQLPFLTVSIVC